MITTLFTLVKFIIDYGKEVSTHRRHLLKLLPHPPTPAVTGLEALIPSDPILDSFIPQCLRPQTSLLSSTQSQL